MQEQLNRLVKLQAVDRTLYELEEEHKTIPGRLADLSIAETKLSEEHGKVTEELDQVSTRRKELEKENEGIRSRVRRAESRLMGAKSQREVRAANAEIEEGRDALKSNEDVVLELMERQEALTTQEEKLAGELKAASAEAAGQRKSLTQRSKSIDKEIAKIKKKRSGLTKGVDGEILDQYDFIKGARQGVALAPVQNGICMACHIAIPPQQFNELQRVDRIMTCPSCRRLIYWADADCFAE